MNTLTMTMTVSGTDNAGESHNVQSKGTYECNGMVTGTREVTDTPEKIWDGEASDGNFGLMILINEGDADGEVRVQDTNGENFSLAIPAGAVVRVSGQWSSSMGIISDTVWLAAYTAQTTKFRYFIFT